MGVLKIALLLLIDINKAKNSIRVLHCGPNIDITVYTSCCEILVAVVGSDSQGYNLDDLVIMGFHHDMVLVPFLSFAKTHDEEVAGSEGRDE